MTLQETGLSINFCDPHLERNTSGIPKPLEIAVETHFHQLRGTKTTLVFLSAEGESSWLLLPNLVSLLTGSTRQPENIYSCIRKVTGQI